MNILHISPYYAPAYNFGGVVRALEGLAEAQASLGHQVTILTTDAFSLEAAYHGNSIETLNDVRVIRAKNWIYPLRRLNLSTPFSMRKLAQEAIAQADVVHLHEFRTVENLLIVPLAAKINKPIILSPHGTINTGTGRSQLKLLWDRFLSPRITAHISQVVALAEAELLDIQALWASFGEGKTQFSVIPNAVKLEAFSNLPDAQPFRDKFGLGDARIVLFMGRLHERKGVEALTRAFLAVNLPNTKLVLAGPDEGMRPTLEKLANENVIFTGFLSGEERLAALAAASLFVLPATGEGLSMAVLEAMATGLPVLLSEGCNFPEAETAGAGKVINPSIENLKNALHEMLSDAAKLHLMSEKARQLIESRYTWQQVTNQLDKVYQALQSQTSDN